MPLCCGREVNSNFCPSCGKAQDPVSGLRGLLRHVQAELAKAERKASLAKSEAEAREKESGYWAGDRAEAARQKAAKTRREADRWKEWEESLIKAIDG